MNRTTLIAGFIVAGTLAGCSKPDVQMGRTAIGDKSIRLFVRYGYDDAILHLSVEPKGGSPKFQQLAFSPYAGFPSTSLSLIYSPSQNGLWIHGTNRDNEIRAFLSLQSFALIDRYGSVAPLDRPVEGAPAYIIGERIPPLAKDVVTVTNFFYQDPDGR